MARTPSRKRKAELPDNIAHLAHALEFVAPASSLDGSLMQTHCRVENRYIIANEGLYALGAPIDDEVTANPNTRKFLAALLKCDGTLSITILASGALSIKAGKFRATIPCAPEGDLFVTRPDPIVAPLTDAFKEAVRRVAPLAVESAPRVVLSSLLVRENTVAATTGIVLVEAWHGISLPYMVVPKKTIARLLAIDKPLVGFGYSGNSATFWYEDQSWLCTRLYTEQWPAIDGLLNEPSHPVPIPPDFWAAVDAIEPWVKGEAGSGFYVFADDLLCSETTPAAGATYELPNFGISGKCFEEKTLDLARPHMLNVDFITHEQRAYFFGEGTRGVVMYGRAK